VFRGDLPLRPTAAAIAPLGAVASTGLRLSTVSVPRFLGDPPALSLASVDRD
jgi:hypothetical protein